MEKYINEINRLLKQRENNLSIAMKNELFYKDDIKQANECFQEIPGLIEIFEGSLKERLGEVELEKDIGKLPKDLEKHKKGIRKLFNSNDTDSDGYYLKDRPKNELNAIIEKLGESIISLEKTEKEGPR